ncbi:MAG TPA: multicopper oxidase [Pseudonocardiaceae bacterium]|jgi:FtsP/CotA-like multicopper oxidase with cupredoxin domain|nr:multicopper oxidase [Pseudonocardiaceae bacterium]
MDNSIGKTSRRRFLVAGTVAGVVAVPVFRQLLSAAVPLTPGSVSTGQTPLPSATIPKYVTPLRTFSGQRVSTAAFTTKMVEFQQQVLPASMYPADHRNGTWLWGYQVDGNQPSWPGVSVEAIRNRATTITYVNALPRNAATSQLESLLTIDQTIHWADPLGEMGSKDPYRGPIPTAVHLHGAEVPSSYDGPPDAWFTSDGRHGAGYDSLHAVASNAIVYQYPNTQPSTTLWFHDHALGITRINVYSGLATCYLLRDQFDTGKPDNPLGLQSGKYEIELMIQDRLFDTNGQLRFPDGANSDSDLNGPPSNPLSHPYWIPEFFGDAMVVNGRTWPVLKVEPRRYRFRFVNACNARFLRMNLTDAATANSVTPPSALPFWQIGTDGGLLDRPVQLNDPTDPDPLKLFLAPSERADVIIDFAGMTGRSLVLTNDGLFPYPSGGAVNPEVDGQIMRFDVTLPSTSSVDRTYDPSTGAALRGGKGQPPAIVRLANPVTGTVAAGVRPSVKRQLVIYEQETVDCAVSDSSDGPLEAFLNNSKWMGVHDGTDTPIRGSVQDQEIPGLWLTELPRIGSTEVWELVNTTEDAHPIHIHLIQFQVLNRQAMDTDSYLNTWAGAFPGGSFAGQQCDGTFGITNYPAGEIMPGYGPPRDYNTPNADGALGGNPAASPFLSGDPQPPDPNEAGWKDTFKVLPHMVNRLLVRWAPIETPIAGVGPGINRYAFDSTVGPGYVWHCHILDHEDNEMMRPYIPVK